MSSTRHQRLPAAPSDTDIPVVEPDVTRGDVPPASADPAVTLLRSFLAPAQRPDELGRLDHYRVLEVLGQGGMGLVCRAEDTRLERPVALKVIRPEMGQREEVRQRFFREAKAVAALEHDHIVTVYTAGDSAGVAYLAMSLLRGETLDERLKRDSRLPVIEVIRVGKEIAFGLAHAHEHGLIHRDVKPANVFLEAGRDRVKLLDFGLARGAGDDGMVTRPDVVVGTPSYMAPEQGRADGVDARADLFSLGVVLYRAAVGRLPFVADDALGVLMAIAQENPRPPHERDPVVPRALSDLIMLLLEKDPARRPESARLVAERLERWEAKAYQQFAEHARKAAQANTPPPDPGYELVEDEPDDEPAPPVRRGPPVVATVALAAVMTVIVGFAAGLVVRKMVRGAPSAPRPAAGPTLSAT